MNKAKVLELIPENRALFSLPALEKKTIARNVIEEIINQIELESRNPFEWEKESLSYAFGLMLSGFYVTAINGAMFCYLEQHEVARPEFWWTETEGMTTQDLRITLAYADGAPLKGD